MPETKQSKQLSPKKRRAAGWQLVLLAFFLFYMLLPILSTYVFSVATRWDRTILPEGYTLEFYAKAAASSYFVSTLRNSLSRPCTGFTLD